jgi:hypothetical protein
MPRHISEDDLALFATGDLTAPGQLRVRWHLAGCTRCQELAKAYRGDQQALQMIASEMPLRVDWDRLSAEMTANIRVGLAAGECVASNPAAPGAGKFRGLPRVARRSPAPWRVAAVCVGVGALMAAAWWLNTPARQTESLSRAVRAIASNPFSGSPFNSPFKRARLFGGGFSVGDDAAFSVAVSTQGIELRENGARLGVSQGKDRPVAVSLNVKGTARARYVDEDTGQVTITSVYAQ